MYGLRTFMAIVASVSLTQAHTVITYPGWRGNNLHTNGTLPEDNPDSLGIDFDNGTASFPWGQQWIYPCKCSLQGGIISQDSSQLTLATQAAACLKLITVQNGPSTVAVSPSSLDGSQAIVAPCSTSTSASKSLAIVRLEIFHIRSTRLLRSQARTTSSMTASSVSHR